MAIHKDIVAYNASQSAGDKRICDALAKAIDRHLKNGECKIWHRHPVWFLDGNPIVGYSKLKGSVRLLFWSGQSFDEPGLQPEGTFKAAEARYTSAAQVVERDLKKWLAKAALIQWDYKNIVKRKGRLEPLTPATKRSRKGPAKTKAPAKSSPVQSAQDVAGRCVVLLAVVASGHNDRRKKLIPWLKREGVLKYASPKERRLLAKPTLTLRDRIYATWRLEAIVPLLWALGRFPKIPPMTYVAFRLRGRMPGPLESTGEFIATAKLRPEAALRREQDRVYNQHWQVRDAEINGKRLPKSISPDYVVERHHALNWLMNDEGQQWDDVSTDT